MCGLCGVMGPGIIAKDMDVLTDLMHVTSLRGPHSTGLYTYTPSGLYAKPTKHRIKKFVGNSVSFLRIDDGLKVDDAMIRTMYTQVFLAHCRYATVGKVTNENAHPFNTGKFIGAHNGTLKDKKFQHADKTDSEMMFAEMETSGIEKTLESLSWLSAYAVTIFDKTKNTLHLGRNSDRPLFFAVNKDRPVLYWASELRMLDFAFEGKKIDAVRYECAPDTLYHFKLTDMRQGVEDPWTMTELNPKSSWISSGTSVTGPKITSASSQFSGNQGMFNGIGVPWYGDIGGDVLQAETCCVCGSYIRAKEDVADRVVFHDQEYLTCKGCAEPSKVSPNREVHIG